MKMFEVSREEPREDKRVFAKQFQKNDISMHKKEKNEGALRADVGNQAVIASLSGTRFIPGSCLGEEEVFYTTDFGAAIRGLFTNDECDARKRQKL